MATDRHQISALFTSMLLNGAVLFGLWLHKLETTARDPLLVIDSIITPDQREQEDFFKELDVQETPAETLNTLAGGLVSTQPGGESEPLKARHKVEVDSVLQNLEVVVNVSPVDVPGIEELGDDLGEAHIRGETGALVSGYGPALDWLTRELIRLMRQDRLLVVWLFDESGSMKDDQDEIKKRIGRVYSELKIVERDPEAAGIDPRRVRAASRSEAVMLTAVTGFGGNYHGRLMKAPSSRIEAIVSAIDRIPVDESGRENMCQALAMAMNQFKAMKVRSKRRLVLIVVSDESGDDGIAVENVLRQARKLGAPIYILGREAVFGSLYAHVRWRQPQTGRIFYLPIRRGPETPFAELLQHDGFRRRRDSHMSGFGPYEQVRLCRETGGIFFQLPHEQQDLNDYEDYKYAAQAMREYRPSLEARSDYVRRRDESDFRRAIREVIVMLNPYDESSGEIELPDPRYQRFTTDPARFGPELRERGRKILAMLGLFSRAIGHLEKVRPLREKEPSVRWRANFDLIRAQLEWYRVRLFEYGIGLDQFVKHGLPQRLAKHPDHNRFSIRETGRQFVLPDEQQQKMFDVTPDDLTAARDRALRMLAEVEERHPETPWARRAAWEARRPFGVAFRTWHRAPPKPSKSRRRPKPPEPPKL